MMLPLLAPLKDWGSLLIKIGTNSPLLSSAPETVRSTTAKLETEDQTE